MTDPAILPTYSPVQPVFARISDTFGRLSLIAISVLFWCIGTAVEASSSNVGQLVTVEFRPSDTLISSLHISPRLLVGQGLCGGRLHLSIRLLLHHHALG